LQGKGMQFPTHSPTKRLIDHLVLLDPCFAGKGRGHDIAGIMIAIAAQILDRDGRIGKSRLDQTFDF
jgi:hypothetical protein